MDFMKNFDPDVSGLIVTVGENVHQKKPSKETPL
jgi:hypothetical protein